MDEVARDIAEIILFASDPKAIRENRSHSPLRIRMRMAMTTTSPAGPKGEVSQSLALKHHVSQSFLRDWSHGSPL